MKPPLTPLLALLAVLTLSAGCAGTAQQTPTPRPEEVIVPTLEGARPAPGAEDLPLLGEAVPIEIEPYALGIIFPTRMSWGPNGEMFVTEKGGSVRVIDPDGVLQTEPVLTIEVNQEGEQGLLGIAVDPTYSETGHVWVFYTWSDPAIDPPEDVFHRVARFTVEESRGTYTGTGLETAWEFRDAFTESTILNGGDVKFGPDGYLYVSAGSTNNLLAVVNRQEPHGKIHRFVAEMPLRPAPENPNGDSVFAYGMRNVYGMTFHPETGILYTTMNGPDCDDEINRVLPGLDYGWREPGLCENNNLPEDYPRRFEPPITSYTPPVSPTGIDFYDHDLFPDWEGALMFCAYNFGSLFWIQLKDDGVNIERSGIIDTGTANCAVDLSVGDDGFIYFSDITGIYRIRNVTE